MTDEDTTTERTPAAAEPLRSIRAIVQASLMSVDLRGDDDPTVSAFDLRNIRHHAEALASENAALRARVGRLRDDLIHEVNRGRQDRGYVPLTAAEIERSRIRLRPGDLVEQEDES